MIPRRNRCARLFSRSKSEGLSVDRSVQLRPGASLSLRVAIVGGSLAGCAAAIALRRAGCQVVVFERSTGALEDRGAGIGMPLALLRTLVERDFIDADMAHFE